jgi:hypothetical protein
VRHEPTSISDQLARRRHTCRRRWSLARERGRRHGRRACLPELRSFDGVLLKDYYTKALEAKLLPKAGLAAAKRGRAAAGHHARALSDALVGAGDVAPVAEDFEFVSPAKTFQTPQSTVTTGVAVLRALLGAYQSASAVVSDPSYRILYASLAASVGQQIGALEALSGRPGAEPFPVAMDLEAASDALEAYLG